MARIFSILAVIAVLLLTANFVVGLAGGDFNAAAKRKLNAQNRLNDLQRKSRGDGGHGISELRQSQQDTPSALEEAEKDAKIVDPEFYALRSRMTLHMLLGTAAALITLLVNSITVTYFIGTSRWCKEVCETYGLSAELAERSTRLKRSTFPWALAGIVSVIVMVGLGAAADPSGANWPRSAHFVLPHYVGAIISIVVVVVAFFVQISRIAENYAVIEQILSEVERIRAAKGLPIEESMTA